ncbi:hypothetical protein Tco_1369898 [Tanacetum coccineum]
MKIRLLLTQSSSFCHLVLNEAITHSLHTLIRSSYHKPRCQQLFHHASYGLIQPTQHYSQTYPSESPLVDSGYAVPVFFLGDDPITCLNIAMAFLIVVASSKFPSTNNQFRTSSNPRNQSTIQDGRVIVQQVQGRQATIQDGRVTVQQVQRRQGQSYSGTGYKSNATSSGGNKSSGQARVVKCYNCQAEAQEAGQILDEEQLAFLVVSRVPDVVFMANISSYGSDVILEVPHSETYLNEIENQSVLATQDFEQPPAEKANKEQNNESITAELERYKERVKTFEQRLNIDLSSHEKMIDSQMDDMIKEKLALKEQVDSLELNLSKQIKEKECLLQTFIVFKSESKEKEDKYMENEINLEKKIKELDNILFKVGQSAQTVHMLTKPQALCYQNLFYLKKAQRIKPTLYDGIVMSAKYVVMPVIDMRKL